MTLIPDLPQDPIELFRVLWPTSQLANFQKDIIRSVWRDDETYVVAGNMLGKDYVAGRIVVLFFLTRYPCRIVTTSTKDKHLGVLWGEIHQAVRESVLPLSTRQGGSLVVLQRELRKVVDGEECPLSYVIGMVASEEAMESFQGHHVADVGDGVPRTLVIGDEASSLKDRMRKMTTSWADRSLWFGNAWPCENFFKQAFKGKAGTMDHGGNTPRRNGKGFYRWTTRIQVTNSPNVRLALLQRKRGIEPTNEIIIPGLKSWNKYQMNLDMWTEDQQIVSLFADWYEGAEQKLFPAAWLEKAQKIAEGLSLHRIGKAIGVDTGEGSANTSVCIVDEKGIIHIASKKTPDPMKAIKMVQKEVREYKVPWSKVFFDLGGGGRWAAAFLRDMGHETRTVAFGGAATKDKTPGVKGFDEKLLGDELKAVYTNKRTEMYGAFSEKLDPSRGDGFGIPANLPVYAELRRQMLPIPRRYDSKGRLWLPPKHKHDPNSTVQTMIDLIGCSPDELDSAVLAVYGLDAVDQWAHAGVG